LARGEGEVEMGRRYRRRGRKGKEGGEYAPFRQLEQVSIANQLPYLQLQLNSLLPVTDPVLTA